MSDDFVFSKDAGTDADDGLTGLEDNRLMTSVGMLDLEVGSIEPL